MPIALVIDLDRPAGLPNEATVLREAIHEFFSQRAEMHRRRLRDCFASAEGACLLVLRS
jgi:hypothetical protein